MTTSTTPTAGNSKPKESLFETLYRFLFGNDIFISYARADAEDYALTLAARLTKVNFLCFLDQLGARPGKKPPPQLIQTLKRATVFVLIASEESINSDAIAEEIREFLTTGRPIIPIDFDGALERAKWYYLIEGIARKRVIQEPGTVTSRPTSSTVRRIGNSFAFMRRNSWLRMLLISASLIFVATLIGSSYVVASAKWSALDSEISATGNVMVSNLLTVEANYERKQAENLKSQAETARDKARENEIEATVRAAAETTKANNAEARKLRADANAAKQETIAQAHQLSYQAQSTLEQRPNLLPRGALYALESLRRLKDIGVRSLDSTAAVRSALSLLLPLESVTQLDSQTVPFAILSSNARYLAGTTQYDAFVVDISSNKTVHLPLTSPQLSAFVPVLFSENGKYLLTVEFDPENYQTVIEVWDPATGHRVAEPLRYGGRIQVITMAPDGGRIAFALGRVVHVSETLTGRDAMKPIDHATDISDLALTMKDSELHLAVATAGEVRVWNVKNSARPEAIIKTSELKADNVKFDSTGHYLASVSTTSAPNLRKTVEIWEWGKNTTAPVIAPIRYFSASSRVQVIFSTDAKHLATASGSDAAYIADLTSGNIRMLQKKGLTTYIAFDPAGRWVVTCGTGNAASVWNVATAEEFARLYHDSLEHNWSVVGAVFSPDSQHLITVSSDDTVRIWRVRQGEPLANISTSNSLNGIAVSPDGRYLATAEGALTGYRANVWDISSGTKISTADHTGLVSAVLFDPAGPYLVTASYDHTVCVWVGWKMGPAARKVACHSFPSQVNAIALSGNGEYLAIAPDYGHVLVLADWQTKTPRTISTLPDPGSVQSLSFSADNHYLATGNTDGIARVWRTRDSKGTPLVQLKHGAIITSLAFSPSGRYLATVGLTKVAEIWDWRVKSATPVAKLEHQSAVLSVAFDQRGQFLIAAGSDRAVRIWDKWNTADPLEVDRINYDSGITFVTLSKDNRQLIAGTSDNHVQVWLWRPDDLIKESCARLGRNLTTEEWQAYLARNSYRKTCRNLP